MKDPVPRPAASGQIPQSAWHTLGEEEVLERLRTGREGLSDVEAERRLLEYGPNELEEAARLSPWRLFVKQFKQILIVILLVATAISALVGELVDAFLIFSIVVAAAVLGFVQEYRAERSLELLKKMAAPSAIVLREDREGVIPARELVPGDIVLVRTGDKVSADVRILEGFNLQTDEAPLTGESTPVAKKAMSLPAETPLAERVNLLFSGTTVTYGHAKGIVYATGMQTEFGRIAKLIQTAEKEPTPLEIRMKEVGNWLVKVLLVAVTVITILGLLRGHQLLEMFLWGVSLAVAAVPEALPAIVTGTLAIGVYRMAQRNVIVRRLPAVETLGATTVICTDKTGTLTKVEMTARRLYLNGPGVEVEGVGYEPRGALRGELTPETVKQVEALSRVAALCNDARLEARETGWQIIGDPTEGALLVLAAKVGLSQRELAKLYPRVGEVPFSSERKMMSTVHGTVDDGLLVCVKGAPEVVLSKCTEIQRGGQVTPLDGAEADRLLRENEQLASQGLRVLGFASRRLDQPPEEYTAERVETELMFLGLVGMIDPPRKEAIEAVALSRQAGVHVVMITGDHLLTAVAVARELGLVGREGQAMTGTELDTLSEADFEARVEGIRVYARVSPEHKLRIVQAWKKRGQVVAMTGDGVNDAPALKSADMGVAMGLTGTDVTKEVSDMVLADDNFVSIVAAMREGRSIFDNIRKYLVYLLSANIGELIIMGIAGLLGWPLPLLAKQLLFLNLVTDGPPALALGIDPPDPYVMTRPPRRRGESVFAPVRGWLVGIALLITVATLVPFYYGLNTYGWTTGVGEAKARSMAFATLILFEIYFALSCRSFVYPVRRVGVFANRFLLLAVVGETLLLAGLFVSPIGLILFDVVPLTALEWGLVAACALTGLVFSEVAKWVRCWRLGL